MKNIQKKTKYLKISRKKKFQKSLKNSKLNNFFKKTCQIYSISFLTFFVYNGRVFSIQFFERNSPNDAR